MTHEQEKQTDRIVFASLNKSQLIIISLLSHTMMTEIDSSSSSSINLLNSQN